MVLRLTQQIRSVPVQNKHSVQRKTEREQSNSDYTARRTYVSLLLILRHAGGKNDSRKPLQLVSPREKNVICESNKKILFLSKTQSEEEKEDGERETGRDPHPCLYDLSKFFDCKELSPYGTPSGSVLPSHSPSR